MRRDIARDFTPGSDALNLATLDAQDGLTGNQHFSVIGSAAFSGEGQVRLLQSRGDVVVQINTVGRTGAGMSILLKSMRMADIDAGDLVL